ncbi:MULTISPECIES: hypothetical protein [unclassified Streptomyces]|uniref:hypothetical protein n=1 Tax=unclassified Streptomyces TaxID=2593676 RepID=UPI001BE9A71C|nr:MULTISPECIES: hypothetical protein [unclassified Streptomyces]MBT2405914.1 hypothetical protein [Streptomyces sp. ISL-21]MBT2453968.1 hypothetical protein [Streptomyces sp. ISL-86]MBT2612268.1 hypothetical protein [Streptomyces sp. ISL-87]
MEIPAAFRWIMLAFAAVQLLLAVRALRPALRAEAGQRIDRWLAFADQFLGAPVSLALAFGAFDVLFPLLVLLGPVLTWQLVRSFQSGRKPKPV